MNPALKDELDEKPSAIVDVTWSTLIRSREARTKEIEGIYMFGMDFSLDLEFFKKFFKKFLPLFFLSERIDKNRGGRIRKRLVRKQFAIILIQFSIKEGIY